MGFTVYPSSFKRVDLGNPVSEDCVREAINKYRGKIALISDFHATMGSLRMVKIEGPDGNYPDESYEVSFVTQSGSLSGTRSLWFHDLEELLVSDDGVYS